MLKKLKRTMALMLTVLLCVCCLPAHAIAEVMQEEQVENVSTAVAYRLHRRGEAEPSDGSWQTYSAIASEGSNAAPEDAFAPLDSVELKLTTEADGLWYKTRNADGTWAQDWSSEEQVIRNEDGLTGLMVKLSDNMEAQYDVWYRAQTDHWLDWTKGPSELVSPDNAPLTNLEVTLVKDGEQAPANAEQVAQDTQNADDGTAQEQEAEDEGEEDEGEDPQLETMEEGALTAQSENTSEQMEEHAVASGATANRSSLAAEAETTPSIEYRTHVQTHGWQGWVKDGAMSGTKGEAKRLEGIYIRLKNAKGSIRYKTHVQTFGWQDWAYQNTMSGTEGLAKRLEGIRIELTGDIAKTYDVWYRVHVQSYGWQGWMKNGEVAGTTGKSKRLEGIEIRLIKKGAKTPTPTGEVYKDTSSNPNIFCTAHVQTYGWLQEGSAGQIIGTTGEAKRMEAVRMFTTSLDGGVQYRTHVQTYGWQDWVQDGELAGTTGEAKRLEAIQIKLTGNAAKKYDLYYRTHVQRVGWTAWAKNGQSCGSSGCSYRMEALQILIKKKGDAAPSSNEDDVDETLITKQQLNGVDISGWQAGINIHGLSGDFVIIKATEGVQGTLANPAYYNPSYATWANRALADGKLVGFYHYANGGDPIKEADWFYYAIKDFRGRAIACLDWEGSGNKLFDTGADVNWCKKFLDRLKSKFGGTPFLYMSKSYTNEYDWSSVAAKYPLWGAQYANYKDVYGYQGNPWQSTQPWGAWGTKPTIFQYTSTGVLGGGSGGMDYLDLDLFYGNRSEWLAYQR